MKDGYIRVASASIDTLIGNVKHNANEIKKILKETREKKAQVVVNTRRLRSIRIGVAIKPLDRKSVV